MASDTLKQIENINKSLRWIKNHRPEHYEQRFLQLVEERRKLRKIAEAEREKPAIAAYGESQKGKSYLIGNLLQKQKSPFMVKDEKGCFVNFVDRVNPIGDRKEATGVVTRFTPFNVEGSAERYSAQHPVIVKLFSPASVATILCDSYYNDLLDKQFYADEEIKSVAERIYTQYKDMPESSQNVLTEDDILDIKAYLQKYVKDAQGILRSGFFENLALVIRRVPQGDWADVLKYLWHENCTITQLFARLLDASRKLGFAHEVYVDFAAVMHLGDNKNTIMSVDCLNGLDDTSWSLTTDVYLRQAEGFTLVSNFPKCELCALCAETIFKIEPEYMNDEDKYYYDAARCDEPGYLPATTNGKLPGSVKKDLLGDTDLLDFPGARNRLKVMENFLTKVDSEAGASNLVQMLLRGKVAYLFNNYSESRIINILLFCHDSDQPNVNDMYRMINDWVEKYVGANSDARRQTINSCGGVSPLFVVGTKFNMDMIEKHKEDGDSEVALNGRWYGRFMKVLYTQSFKAESMDWFNNWDAQGCTFKNTFLLRDYKYSGCDGSGNNLYEGYNENDENPRETALHLSPEFYARLRDTFVSNPDVKKFFADPAKSWDVAATLNNDGALYIIERLAVVARKMGVTRNEQFIMEEEDIRRRIVSIMKEYYVSDDTAELLDENVRKANEIFREMEFTCQAKPEYFGHMIKTLQLTEAESFKRLHQLIPTLTGMVTGTDKIKDYELIRKRCGDFAECKNEAEKWAKLIACYRFTNQEEATRYLSMKGIEPSKLFAGETLKRKNSAVIADDLMELWENNIQSVRFMNAYAGQDLVDEISMNNLVDCLINAANCVNLRGLIESQIADYTDVLNAATINEALVSDLIAMTISDFIMNFGYNYLTDEQKDMTKRVSSEQHLPCYDWISRERKEHYSSDEMTDLFNDILSSTDHFTPSYDANYNNWLEYMYIAFIAHINVPDYDRDANEELKAIIDDMKK